ncbi:LacI family DNA-binding transcriptional regulator [Caviibacterium pharyngocola]|uniref:GntR family transcriptional regulator n=1 Tax=Caviibacterium pharyngocola TaxID=28159 RepID=A0A2M8RUY2_9PAST|nr:LacI family DNA-binding transcriptional regulator [Caviibacterium pharyngocola]PJG82712.1 GntR family transcriptional regulator [Caviibacterium pharyngocola]
MMMNLTRKRRSTEKVTLADVAKYAGVGTMTVSRALRTPELVSAGLREKIERAVAELGYVPNLAARELASVSSKNIVIITSSIHSTENALILAALQQELAQMDVQLVILIANNSQWLKELINYAPLAVILLNLDYSDIDMTWLVKSNIPCIDIGAKRPSSFAINVGIDTLETMQLMLNYLARKGYREIGLLSAQQNLSISQQYLENWHKALLRKYLNPHLILHSTDPMNFSTGAKLLSDALATWGKVDALVFLSDELACGALFEAQRKHISIPYDVAVVGLGGLEVGSISYPTLTTIEIPYAQLGKIAGQKLIECLRQKNKEIEPHFISLPVKLLARNSA